MDREREEVYERIPWETLEQKSNDRQWILFAIAGAVVVGALAYSYTSTRPIQPPEAVVAATQPAPVAATPEPAQVPVAPSSTSPIVVSEADLYAVHPERLIDEATAHAEWFAAEYYTVDGSEETARVLAGLLPVGVPMPTSDNGSRVFVEWVRSVGVQEIGPGRYEVEVLVRSLKAGADEIYQRQPPLVATIEVVVDGSGPRVALPPRIRPVVMAPQETLALIAVPDEVRVAALAAGEFTQVVGGIPASNGGWRVVVIATGSDGVSRPVTVDVP